MSPNLAGILAMLMWASMTTLIALNEKIPPFELGTLTSVITFLMLGIFYKAKGESLSLQWRRPISDYAFVSSGIFLYTALLYCAFHYIPAFEANALNYLWPAFLMLFLSLFQKTKLTLLQITGIIISFIGCLILFNYRSQEAGSGTLNIGHICGLAAPIVWALYSCFAKTKHYPTSFLVPVFFVSIFLNLALHLMFEDTIVPTNTGWVFVVILSVLRIAYVLWDYAIRNGDRVFLSSLSYLIPFLATCILIAAGFFTTNVGVIGGGILIVMGCLIVNAKGLYDGIMQLRYKI